MSEIALEKNNVKKKKMDSPIVWVSKRIRLARKLINLQFKLNNKKIKEGFELHSIQNVEEEDQMYQLRYRVYCEEYNYLDPKNYPDKREKDVYDPYSVHFVILNKNNSHESVIGTVRIIRNSKVGFPLENNFKIDLNSRNIPRDSLIELSRLVIDKKYRIDNYMLDLVRELYHYVKRFKIEYVYSVMDERLFMPLQKMQYPFVKIGNTTQYQGSTTPFLLKVSDMENGLLKENPKMYYYLLEGLEDRYKPNFAKD